MTRKRYTGRQHMLMDSTTAHTQLRQAHRGELNEKRGQWDNQKEDQSHK
jgi:hypothetical protein